MLLHGRDYDWESQGFGLMRTYLDKDIRLHIWDDSFLVPGVTMLHTHPWNFHSTIICGTIKNTKFTHNLDGELYHSAKIITGSNPEPVLRGDVVLSGETRVISREYSQNFFEIHSTSAVDGTITVVSRSYPPKIHESKGTALVFWQGEKFVSADPHHLPWLEASVIIDKTLERWF